MDGIISAPVFAIGWLLGMLLMMELGRRTGVLRLARDPDKGIAGPGTIDGALFALFGLLIAFTFSGGVSRLDSRRQLIAEEANDIGTAYLRLDLLPKDEQASMRELFRRYVDSRLAVYQKLPDVTAARAELVRSAELQNRIWSRAVPLTNASSAHPDAGRLLLPAINSMIDITTTRLMAARLHPPQIVYYVLFLVGLICSFLAGFSMADYKHRNWVYILSFVVIMSVSVYVILALEYPRISFINLGAYDDVLVELRQSMN